jgi:hypothetical protein
MAEFTTESIFQALRSMLGIVDNEERRQQIEAYIEAARQPVERAVFDLLSEFAEAVNGAVGADYEVELAYRPGVLELKVGGKQPGEATEEFLSSVEGEIEKVTLRLPAEMKELAMEAATRAGLSANSWFVRMLARSLRASEAAEPAPPPSWGRGRHGHRGPGQRLSGWVGPEE